MTQSFANSPRLVLDIDVTDLTDEARVDFTEEVAHLLQKYRSQADTEGAEQDSLGWDCDTLEQALTLLERDGGWVQAKVIRRALENGGYASRDEVYELGEYEPNRMLRGFTRPVNRIVARMKESGQIPEGAANLLEPVYDSGVQAGGFRVPRELVDLLDNE